MVVIIDYGVGNLFSLISSFKAIGVEAVATGDNTGLPGFGNASDEGSDW